MDAPSLLLNSHGTDRLLDVLLANLAGQCWVDPRDWMTLRQACKAMRDACDRHTTRTFSCEGRMAPVELFQWGQASATEPRFYISLTHPNISRSFGWKGITTGETHWFKIRFHPETMMVHTGDYTFAKQGAQNTPRRNPHKNVRGVNASVPDLGDLAPRQFVNVGEYTPYATCFDCSAPHSDRAHSTIDLRGTPFAVRSQFKHGGYRSNGSWVFSLNDQLVQLTGGGFCGWTASKDNPGSPDDRPGAWALKLKFVPD